MSLFGRNNRRTKPSNHRQRNRRFNDWFEAMESREMFDGSGVICDTTADMGALSQCEDQSENPLVAYWDFNDAHDPGQSLDLVANRPAMLRGGATHAFGHSGEPGDHALDLQGEGDYAIVTDASFLNPTIGDANEFTFSFWQHHRHPANSSSFWAVSNSSSGANRGVQVHAPWSNGNIYFDTNGCCDENTSRISTQSPVDVSNETWNHFAFVKQGETKLVWLNGQLATSGINTLALPTDFTQLYLGSGQDGNYGIQGLLDDFSIFSKALGADQIEALYNGASPASLFSHETDGSRAQLVDGVLQVTGSASNDEIIISETHDVVTVQLNDQLSDFSRSHVHSTISSARSSLNVFFPIFYAYSTSRSQKGTWSAELWRQH